MPAVNWSEVGMRVRIQRTYLGYTRESLSEQLGVTPKFCSDIELGQKGMSVQTLSALSNVLKVSTDYILFGTGRESDPTPLMAMLYKCPHDKLAYAEEILKTFLMAL